MMNFQIQRVMIVVYRILQLILVVTNLELQRDFDHYAIRSYIYSSKGDHYVCSPFDTRQVAQV